MLCPRLKRALRGGIAALLVACSSNPHGTPETRPEDAPAAGAVADAVSAAANCELMTCPTSTPAHVEGCAQFETLGAASLGERTVLSVSGTTRGASNTSHSEFGGCAGATSGPDVWYQLDLSNAPQPLKIHAVVDASFDAALDLRRGPCGDTRSMSCDRAAVVGRVSSSLSERLDPGVYWLVIDGANESSAGDFRLEVEVDPLLGCANPLPNQSCETAVPLEALERQTVLLDEACATEAGDDVELYYALDLSAEVAPVLANVSIWNLSQPHYETVSVYALDADPPDCETALAYSYLGSGAAQSSSAELQLLLSPGRYAIEASPDEILKGNQVALTVQLDRTVCAGGPLGNDCVDALDDIDPTAVSQVVAGNTACNTNRRTLLPCSLEGENAPEQFHRLDLRGAPGITRARLTVLVDGVSFLPLLSVWSNGANGECGDALYCDDRVERAEGPPHVDLLLEPTIYFVGIDSGDRGSSGPYQLLVELAPGEPRPCVTLQIDECMSDGNQTRACCFEWSPLCSQMVALCGLSPATQDCVCTANPACCTSNLLPPDCGAAQLACNYLCPDFAPQESSCLAARR